MQIKQKWDSPNHDHLIIFKHFSTYYNTHMTLILSILALCDAIRKSTIYSDWFPYSSIVHETYEA